MSSALQCPALRPASEECISQIAVLSSAVTSFTNIHLIHWEEAPLPNTNAKSRKLKKKDKPLIFSVLKRSMADKQAAHVLTGVELVENIEKLYWQKVLPIRLVCF